VSIGGVGELITLWNAHSGDVVSKTRVEDAGWLAGSGDILAIVQVRYGRAE